MHEPTGKSFFTAKDLYGRYQITKSTLNRWLRKTNFPSPLLVGKTRRFSIIAVIAWEERNTH